MKRRSYSQEFKRQAVTLVLKEGQPIRFVSGTLDGGVLNLAGLLLNIVIIYFLVIGVKILIDKIKGNKAS